MTRPHALPRRSARRGSGPFPAIDLQLPATRVFACANLVRADKAIVDAFQAFLSFREGRAVSQVETMHVLLVLALSHEGHPMMAGFEVPAHLLGAARANA